MCAFALLLASAAFAADDLAVDVQNASEPTLCAEKDNVYLKLTSPEVRRFKIEAVHPNYIGTIVVDRSAFDLHNCPDLAAAPLITEQPRRVTIFETPDLQLVGITIPNFWRKTIVPVRVGDRIETGVQLLQLWVRAQRPRRGSAGALSAGRLLARAPAAAAEPEMERLRLVVPGRADRDQGTAVRRHQGGRVRPEHQDVPPGIHARRQRDAAAWRRSTPTSRCST